MIKIIIPDGNTEQNIERAAISESMPYDMHVASFGEGEVLEWGKDISYHGDKIKIKDRAYNMPINYQMLRFRHGAHRRGLAESSRWYSMRPQLLIPMDALVVGYTGTAAEFAKICSNIPRGVYYVGAITDPQNISKYDWTVETRTVIVDESVSKRAILYQSCDLYLINNKWARPTLEATAAGIPTARYKDFISSIDNKKSLYATLRAEDNDSVVHYDRSYFIRDLVRDWGLATDEPLISICINVYNRESLIAYAIESALRQSYQNIELVIVDDCSSDRSREIIEYYAESDDRITYKFLPENVGCPGSWSEAMRMAKGQLITYTSSDNIQDYGQIWHLNRYWQHRHGDIVYGKPRYFGGQNRVVYSRSVNRNMALNCAGLGPSFLIPRWLLDETDLMHKEDIYVEDTSLTADMCTMGAKVSLMPKDALYYYRHGDSGSMTSKVNEMGGYGTLLRKMAANRERRRNKALSKISAIYIKDMDAADVMSKYIVSLMKMGFNGTLYSTAPIAQELRKYGYAVSEGYPEVSKSSKCGWGSEALVLDRHGYLYRCPERNCRRGRVYGDFFINEEPRPCYLLETCER